MAIYGRKNGRVVGILAGFLYQDWYVNIKLLILVVKDYTFKRL